MKYANFAGMAAAAILTGVGSAAPAAPSNRSERPPPEPVRRANPVHRPYRATINRPHIGAKQIERERRRREAKP